MHAQVMISGPFYVDPSLAREARQGDAEGTTRGSKHLVLEFVTLGCCASPGNVTPRPPCDVRAQLRIPQRALSHLTCWMTTSTSHFALPMASEVR